MSINRHFLIGVLALGTIAPGFAQSWDNSGNGLLNGTYYFRHVLWFVGDEYGDLGDALTLYNTITFDGNGHYTITGATVYDAYENASEQYSVSGTYTIAASGYGFMDSPASSLIGLSTPDEIYGLVSNGIFMGTATENDNGYNDMFIAAPATGATASTFSGTYAIAGMDQPGLGETYGVAYGLDYLIQGTANGSGSFSVSKAEGYIGANGGEATAQNGIGTVKYSFSNGAATVNFPTNQNYGISAVVSGQHYMYISPDGNFVFGGQPFGWDFFVGVKTGGSFNYTGLYYQAGMDLDDTYLSEYDTGLQDSYFSSFKAESVGHQRVNSFANTDSSGDIIPYDFTFIDDVSISGNSGSDGFQNYLYSANGQYRVGVGNYPGLGFSAAIAAPTFTGSGMALDPTGLVNTASNALFTSRIAPGELLTIYGQGGSTLASGSGESTTLTLPTTLQNTQVMVNGVSAPVLAVNECGPYPCVTFVVPYETVSPGIADIQLVNTQGNTSNTISAFVGYTAPGIFLQPQFGQGSGNMYYSAAVHATPNTSTYGTIVSPSNPAQVGETVSLYMTGIGAVQPSVADGAPGPVNPTAGPINTLSVYLSSTSATGLQEVQGTTSYIGLAPEEVAGLAQINLVIPSVTSGDNVVEIAGPDSDTFMTLISVGSTAVSSARPADVAQGHARLHSVRPRVAKIRQPHPVHLSEGSVVVK